MRECGAAAGQVGGRAGRLTCSAARSAARSRWPGRLSMATCGQKARPASTARPNGRTARPDAGPPGSAALAGQGSARSLHLGARACGPSVFGFSGRAFGRSVGITTLFTGSGPTKFSRYNNLVGGSGGGGSAAGRASAAANDPVRSSRCGTSTGTLTVPNMNWEHSQPFL